MSSPGAVGGTTDAEAGVGSGIETGRADTVGRVDTSGADAGVQTTDRRSGTVAALGEPALLQGFRLAGAVLYPATGPAQVHSAWTGLPDSVVAVLLTPAAAGILAVELADPASPLTAVLPDPASPPTPVLP